MFSHHELVWPNFADRLLRPPRRAIMSVCLPSGRETVTHTHVSTWPASAQSARAARGCSNILATKSRRMAGKTLQLFLDECHLSPQFMLGWRRWFEKRQFTKTQVFHARIRLPLEKST